MKDKSGFLLIKKPKDITSYSVVEKIKKITGIKKVGHSGTLDPFAEGLLIIGVGRNATKKLSQILKYPKEYIATIRLGKISDTFDRDGKIENIKVDKPPSLNKIKDVLKKFKGKIKQIPPPFSAKKIKGKKLYELARKGIKITLPPINIEIYKIFLLKYKWPRLKIKVKCSSGTYIRSLSNDIGNELKCGGYLEKLLRTKIGFFNLKNSKKLSQINSSNWSKFLLSIK